MIKIILAFVFILFASSLYFFDTWLKEENGHIHKINQKYQDNTRKLKEIIRINKWLEATLKKELKNVPQIAENADMQLIEFFDKYAKKYNFQVQKFIYKDKFGHFLDIKYSLPRANYNKLLAFLQQNYTQGYLILKKLNISQGNVEGELVLMQPFASKIQQQTQGVLDDVPQ